jgi:hypothetical protein
MAKRTTNQMIALDIRQVHRAGGLVPGHLSSRAWTWGSGSVSRVFLDAGIDLVTLSYRGSTQGGVWQECSQRVAVEWTPCNYGGSGHGGSAQSVECESPSCTTVGNTPAGTVTTSPSSPPGSHRARSTFRGPTRFVTGSDGVVASPVQWVIGPRGCTCRPIYAF